MPGWPHAVKEGWVVLGAFLLMVAVAVFIGWYFDGQTGYGIGPGDMR